MDFGEYEKVVNGVKAVMEYRARKERAYQNVASTATSVSTNGSSSSNRDSGG